jgi:hypothetical protein
MRPRRLSLRWRVAPVCNASGCWQLSAECGSGSCIENTNGVTHDVFCVPKMPSATSEEPRDLDLLASGSELACQSGTYDCAYAEGTFWVIVCDGQNWNCQSNCDPYQLCKVKNNSARCYTPPKPTVPPQLQARAEPATTSTPTPERACQVSKPSRVTFRQVHPR